MVGQSTVGRTKINSHQETKTPVDPILPACTVRTGADTAKGGFGLGVVLLDEIVEGFESVVFQGAPKDLLSLP